MGSKVLSIVGTLDGVILVGWLVRRFVGTKLGALDGLALVGLTVGESVGMSVGTVEGTRLGAVGITLGSDVG